MPGEQFEDVDDFLVAVFDFVPEEEAVFPEDFCVLQEVRVHLSSVAVRAMVSFLG